MCAIFVVVGAVLLFFACIVCSVVTSNYARTIPSLSSIGERQAWTPKLTANTYITRFSPKTRLFFVDSNLLEITNVCWSP